MALVEVLLTVLGCIVVPGSLLFSLKITHQTIYI